MSMVTSPEANGHGATAPDELAAMGQRLEQALSAECADLRAILEGERALVAEITARLKVSRDRQHRLERALALLEGDAPRRGRPPKAADPTGPAWKVSDAKAEKVYEGLVALGGEAKPTAITQQTGIAADTVRKALHKLRDAQRVRIVANHPGRGTTFGVMPGTDGA